MCRHNSGWTESGDTRNVFSSARVLIMARKSKASSEPFTVYENFLYLLAEIELVIGSQKIQWSPITAAKARGRLEVLVAKMSKLEGGSGTE